MRSPRYLMRRILAWARSYQPVEEPRPGVMSAREVGKVILVQRLKRLHARIAELEERVDALEDTVLPTTVGSPAGNKAAREHLAALNYELLRLRGESTQVQLLRDAIEKGDVQWYEVAARIGRKF